MATVTTRPTASVVSDPQILGGMPVVSGTRVPAETILAYIRKGADVEEIVGDYPYLPLGAREAVEFWARETGQL